MSVGSSSGPLFCRKKEQCCSGTAYERTTAWTLAQPFTLAVAAGGTTASAARLGTMGHTFHIAKNLLSPASSVALAMVRDMVEHLFM